PRVGAVTSGPGVTATTITLGVTYYQSAQAANAALGAAYSEGDPVALTTTLIKAINASGGIAGRHVKVLTFGVDPQSPQPYASEAQAMCSYFTQDHEVFAVLSGTPALDATACLARKGVAVLGGELLKLHL